MREQPAVIRVSREAQLLLCCARTRLAAAHSERVVSLLGDTIDWAELLRLAWLHRVLPLLHWHIQRIGVDHVPRQVLDELRGTFTRNARRNLLLMRELREILTLFEVKGIHAIPYKGPALAQQIYGNLALREMGDLDILVQRRNLQPALELLHARGYRAKYPTTSSREQFVHRYENNRELIHERSGEILELHWALNGPRFAVPLDVEGLWQRAHYRSLGGGKLPVLAPEDLLIALCFHGSRHMWERLEWITGVAELVRIEQVDWGLLMMTAERHGSKRMLLLGLALAHEWLDAALPEEILGMVRADGALTKPMAWVRENLFPGREAWSHSFGMQFHRFQLQVKERRRDRLRYAFYAMVSPAKEDWRAVPLPDALSKLYYIIRPIRIAATQTWRGLRSST